MQQNKQKKARQYLIDLQRWRSAAALTACCVTLVFTLISVNSALVRYSKLEWQVSDYFRYFTTLSNMLTALASSFIIPFAVNGIRRKRYVYPKWLALMHYTGTIGTTTTMLFSLIFILPWDPEFAVGPENFYLHVVCPIAVLISFELVECNYEFTRKQMILCMVPFFVYSLIYLIMVVFLGKERGGWEDIYMLNTFVPVYFSLPAVWIFVYIIAWGIRKTSNLFSRYRLKRMMSLWQDDMEPVEINIEIYGLGRYNGLHDEKSEMSVPYDILEALAAKYNMDPAALMKVYSKGLLDAVNERKQAARPNQ